MGFHFAFSRLQWKGGIGGLQTSLNFYSQIVNLLRKVAKSGNKVANHKLTLLSGYHLLENLKICICNNRLLHKAQCMCSNFESKRLTSFEKKSIKELTKYLDAYDVNTFTQRI